MVRDGRSRLVAEAALLGVAMVWGASYPVAKEALLVAPALALILLRFAISAAVVGIVARRDLLAAAPADLARALALGAILFAIFIAETFGVAATTATNAAFLISLCTVLTPLIDRGLDRSLPPGGVLAGAALCVLGAGLLGGGLSRLGPGDALILAAALLRACLVVATRRLTAGRALPPAAVTAVQCATVAGLAGVALAASPGPGWIASGAGATFWAAVLFLSLLCTVGALFVQNAALRRASPTAVSFLFGTEPVFGLVFAHLLLAEPVTGRVVAGGLLIVAGTAFGLAAEVRGRAPDGRG